MRIPFQKQSRGEYWVSVDRDEDVAPEETLIDSQSGLTNIERPIPLSIFRIAIGGVLLIAAIIAVTSFQIGVIQHEAFAALAVQNRTLNVAVSPPRGIISDIEGRPLVKNIPSFDLFTVSREITSISSEDLFRVADILGEERDAFIERIQGEASAQSVFFIATDLSKEQVLAITEAHISGMHIITSTKREYIYGPQFSHIVGYTGKVNAKDLERDEYYELSDRIGRLGVEASYEQALRGTHGRVFFTRDVGQSITREPEPGKNVVLTINQDIQRALYQDVFEVIRGTTIGGAAAVVQDPHNGAVQALVSFPEFDNNILSGTVSQDDYNRLFTSSRKPLFNRVTSGLYSPGSTIKPLIGLMALQEGVVTPQDTIRDCIDITIRNPFGVGISVFKNWRPDVGLFNITRAIADSCNVYFFTVGGGFGEIAGLGIQNIMTYLKDVFADRILGIDLPGEEAGFVPTPDWKLETRGDRWYQGDTYNISIGQGDLLVTPLWINTYISAIANGGVLYRPRIVSRIVDSGSGRQEVFEPEELTTLPFNPEHLATIQYAMEETVRSGTAKILSGLPVPVAVKTGTAEVVKGGRVNSIFTAYAPADNPRISITILIEGADDGQSYAIRAANAFLGWYFRDYISPTPTLDFQN